MANVPFKIKKSVVLVPESSPTLTVQGELAFDATTDSVLVRNSSSTDTLVQLAAIQTLTNKTISGNDNTLSDIDYSSLVLSNSIVDADISSSAAIAFSKLAALNSGNILVGNGSNVAVSVAMSGEASISNAGAVTLSNSAVIGKVLTGFVAAAGTVSATDSILQAIQKLSGSSSGTNTGDVSLTAVGATPNANGASLSGQALTLQPADATNPGVLTAGAQNIGGNKLFNDGLSVLGPMSLFQDTDAVTTGPSATIPDTNNPVTILTDSGLISVTGIANTSGDPKVIVVTNSAGSAITLLNDVGTASERIITGTGANLVMENSASVILYYNGTDSKWYVVGGAASGDVAGPGSSTDNAIVRFDSTTGKIIQNSGVIIDDSNNVSSINNLGFSGALFGQIADDPSAGSNQTLALPSTSIVNISGALVSIDGITAPAAGVDQFFVLTNSYTSPVTINNATGSAANQILTGTGAALSLAPEASLLIIRDGANQRWKVVGGTGSGSSGGSTTLSVVAGENLAVNDAVYISIGAGDGGRTAGRAYKLDATNDNRMEFVGFNTAVVTAGNNATIQLAGELSGFSGLSTGLPVFASVSSPGLTQNSTPNVNGQWIIQLGIATSTTKLAINAAGSAAASKVSSDSIASEVKYTPYATENISNGATITTSTTVGLQVRKIQGNGAAVSVAATGPFPSLGSWPDGTVIRLVGQSDTNTVTITHSDTGNGVILNGTAVLGRFDALELQYDASTPVWFETSRSIK